MTPEEFQHRQHLHLRWFNGEEIQRRLHGQGSWGAPPSVDNNRSLIPHAMYDGDYEWRSKPRPRCGLAMASHTGLSMHKGPVVSLPEYMAGKIIRWRAEEDE